MEVVLSVGQSYKPRCSSQLNMLFKARNEALRAVQTVICVYLHANGVPTQVTTLLSQYGISVGLDALETITESLAKD
jgi:hypothetical protein